jgi:hypothetical protein
MWAEFCPVPAGICVQIGTVEIESPSRATQKVGPALSDQLPAVE